MGRQWCAGGGGEGVVGMVRIGVVPPSRQVAGQVPNLNLPVLSVGVGMQQVVVAVWRGRGRGQGSILSACLSAPCLPQVPVPATQQAPLFTRLPGEPLSCLFTTAPGHKHMFTHPPVLQPSGKGGVVVVGKGIDKVL